MSLALKLSLFFFVIAATAPPIYAQELECRTPDGSYGICKSLWECPSLNTKADLIRKRKVPLDSPQRAAILQEFENRRTVCHGGENKMYCCSDCITPDNKGGLQKDIRNCSHLINLLKTKKIEDLIYLLQRRIPGRKLDFCCTFPAREDHQCNSEVAFPPNPDTKCCGFDTSTTNRIVGGATAEIDQFPWTVILEVADKNKYIRTTCAGSLISNRHVVTAAHCLTEIPKYVRVGDWNKHHPGRDCLQLADETKDCNDGSKSVLVESYLRHDAHNSRKKSNDIALLRLKEPVKYTDYVRPICLPTVDFSDPSNLDRDFDVVGWGSGSFKQYVNLGAVDLQECRDKFHPDYNPPFIGPGQICAGGEWGKDSCRGDSGGPLMAKTQGSPYYELAGVVSFGAYFCGGRGVPGVYTNVYVYLDWIQKKMRDDSDGWVPVGITN